MQLLTWSFRVYPVVITLLILLIARTTLSHADSATPILLVIDPSASNKFGAYLGEILRAEGLNTFTVKQLNEVTAAELSAHELTILAEMPLSGSQANLFNNYVNNGGRLLAMRPDAQIAGLFGLGTANGILNNGYVKINTSATINGEAPGQGLTGVTLQIHGEADRYGLVAGSVMLAQLYSTATTSTVYPAVVSNSTGRAVAFTYDLAQNVVYTRQGNPANADVDTDEDGVLRTIDLFQSSGGAAPWVDLDRIAVPQADEQQRLFARLVKQMVGQSKPLPQLWYFPGQAKTMLILTADGHFNGVTQFEDHLNSITAHGGKVTTYLTLYSISQEMMQAAVAEGHDFGIHPWSYDEVMGIFSLQDGYDVSLDWWGQYYPQVPMSRTVRNHQIRWLGWTEGAELAASRGIRMDTDFYHWGAWLQKEDNSWPHGYLTGSGQPMKFIRADGQLINNYQQLTQLVDEQLLRPPDYAYEDLTAAQALAVSKGLIDGSQGGDYAALMTQFHVDYYSGKTQTWAEGTMDYAISQGVPIWNAEEWLSFTETRHDAEYSNISWLEGTKTLSFSLTATPTVGISLTTILPLDYQGNSLESVKVDNQVVAYQVETIKGVDVAFVTLPAGNHLFIASYGQVVGVDITPTGGSTLVSETGLTDTYRVKLTSVPTAPVKINFITDAQLNTLSPITFTTLTWNVPQTVIVSAVDDALVEGLHTSLISHTTTSTDSNYNNLPVASLSVNIIDNDAPGVDITESGGTTEVSENGVTDTYQLKLTKLPTANVRINFITDAQLNALGAITFTTLNWNIPQTVTVSAIDDALAEGLHSSVISYTATSADPGYNGLSIAGVNTTINDNDNAGVNAAPTSLGVAESGITATYSISLTSQPSANVQINFATNSQLNPINFITFTPSNWNSAQTVLVSAVDDTLVEGTHSSVINHTAASSDPTYNNLAIVPVNVTIADNDNILPTGSITTTTSFTDFLQACTVLTNTSPTPLLSSTFVSDLNGGTVRLDAEFADDFNEATIDSSRWLNGNWQGNGNVPGLSNGIVTLPFGTWLRSQTTYTHGAVEVLANFETSAWQHIGFAAADFGDPNFRYFIFSTFNGSTNLYIRVNNSNSFANEQRIDLGPVPTGWHRYRIDWTALDALTDRVSFYLDGILQTQLDVTNVGASNFYLYLSNNGASDLKVDLAQVSPPYVSSGSYTSCIFDAYQLGAGNNWGTISWDAILAAPAGLTVETRTSSNGTVWTGWTAMPGSGSSLPSPDRYAQYRLLLNTTDTQTSPLVNSVTFDLASPRLAVADTVITEGDVGSTNASFVVSLSVPTALTVTVPYSTANGSALAPADYGAINGTLIFTPGVTSQTITVPVQGDSLDEADEIFQVNLSSPVNAALDDGQGLGTILDDDNPPAMTITDASVTEGNVGLKNTVFTVTLTAASSLTVTVNYTTTNSTALAPADYLSQSGTLTFTPGVTTQLVMVPVQGDSLNEADETFLVNLNNAAQASVADGQGQGTILNDDAAPNLSIAGASVTEGHSGTASAVFTVTLSAASEQTATVNYATVDNTAVSPADFLSQSGILTFTPGVTRQLISVTVNGDQQDEADETFGLSLSAPLNAALPGGPGIGTILDDDSAGVVVNPLAVNVSEGGVTATYAITLTSQPTTNVTIALNPGSQLNVNPANVIFSPADWDTSQTITVTAVDDALAEGTHTGVISHTVVSSDNNYNGLVVGHITATITDNDTAGVTVTPTSVTVMEGGVTDTYNIVLTSQPTSPVTITLTTGGQTAALPASLTFTSLTWRDPQTVTVTAVDDFIVEGAHSDVISHTATSSDSNFNGISISPVTASITDNDVAGVAVIPTNVTLAEAGITDTYQVRLASQPAQAVTITLTPDGQTAVNPLSLTFTTLDWSTPQTVTVTAIDDSVVEGVHPGVISHTVASGDGNYNGLAISQVTASINDNDTAGVSVAPALLNVSESGITATYTISLTSQPTSSVTITLNPNDQISTVPGGLNFTSLNWNSPQTVTVTGVNDLLAEGVHSGVISHTASSADSNYNGISIGNVTVTITDNDTAGIGVAPISVNVAEGGITATYAISLTSQPTAPVTVTVTADAQTSITPTTVVFNQFNWFWPSLVEVTAVDDALAEGTHTSAITHAIASADSTYAGLSTAGVTAHITDNDLAGVTVTPTNVTVSEAGTTGLYRIVLNSQPTQPVTITLTTDGQTTVTPLALNFTSLNWANAQTVTVTAVDDLLAEGNHSSVISHTAASGDSNYNGLIVSQVTAGIADNDTAGVNLAPTNLAVTEGGLTAAFAISLTSQPTGAVTISLNPDSQVTVNAGLGLTFTPSNWNVAQVITVTAVDDALVEGTHSGIISQTVSSADPKYNGVAVSHVTVTITDNDSNGGNEGNHQIFLPLILGQTETTAPDLIVESVIATHSTLQLTIKNQGNAAVTSDFWVDVYINPQPTPTKVNQVWNDGRSTYGATWGVRSSLAPLPPGSTLTLSIGDANYWPSLSHLPATLTAGMNTYAQVDSANLNTGYGGVLEGHEMMGQSYNNISGPIFPAAGLGEILLPLKMEAASALPSLLPSRP